MLRILSYMIVLMLVALLLSRLPSYIDPIIILYQSQRIHIPANILLGGILLAILLLFISFHLIRKIVNLPKAVQAKVNQRQRNKTAKLLQQGFFAALADDAKNLLISQRYLQNSKYQPSTPISLWLAAKQAKLEGDNLKAIDIYQKLLHYDESKLAALHELYKEAIDRNANDEALIYAQKANKIAPAIKWAYQQHLQSLAIEGNWDKAIELVNKHVSHKGKGVDDTAKRHYAVLFTAKAMASFNDYNKALKAVNQAIYYLNDFAPALEVKAKLLLKNNKIRRATKFLKQSWIISQHPPLATSYVYLDGRNKAEKRLYYVNELLESTPDSDYLRQLKVRALLEVGQLEEARELAEFLLQTAEYAELWLLLADIEECQTGNKALINQYLEKASLTAKNPSWVADNTIFNHWLPISPISQSFDSFSWATIEPPKAHKPAIDLTTASEGENKPETINLIEADQTTTFIVDDPGVVNSKDK